MDVLTAGLAVGALHWLLHSPMAVLLLFGAGMFAVGGFFLMMNETFEGNLRPLFGTLFVLLALAGWLGS